MHIESHIRILTIVFFPVIIIPPVSCFPVQMSTCCETKLKLRCLLDSLLLSSSDSGWGQERTTNHLITDLFQERIDSSKRSHDHMHIIQIIDLNTTNECLRCIQMLEWSKRGDQHLRCFLQYKLKLISAYWRAILNQCFYIKDDTLISHIKSPSAEMMACCRNIFVHRMRNSIK